MLSSKTRSMPSSAGTPVSTMSPLTWRSVVMRSPARRLMALLHQRHEQHLRQQEAPRSAPGSTARGRSCSRSRSPGCRPAAAARRSPCRRSRRSARPRTRPWRHGCRRARRPRASVSCCRMCSRRPAQGPAQGPHRVLAHPAAIDVERQLEAPARAARRRHRRRRATRSSRVAPLLIASLTMRRCSSSGTRVSPNTPAASTASPIWWRPEQRSTKPMRVLGRMADVIGRHRGEGVTFPQRSPPRSHEWFQRSRKSIFGKFFHLGLHLKLLQI